MKKGFLSKFNKIYNLVMEDIYHDYLSKKSPLELALAFYGDTTQYALAYDRETAEAKNTEAMQKAIDVTRDEIEEALANNDGWLADDNGIRIKTFRDWNGYRMDVNKSYKDVHILSFENDVITFGLKGKEGTGKYRLGEILTLHAAKPFGDIYKENYAIYKQKKERLSQIRSDIGRHGNIDFANNEEYQKFVKILKDNGLYNLYDKNRDEKKKKFLELFDAATDEQKKCFIAEQWRKIAKAEDSYLRGADGIPCLKDFAPSQKDFLESLECRLAGF